MDRTLRRYGGADMDLQIRRQAAEREIPAAVHTVDSSGSRAAACFFIAAALVHTGGFVV